MLSNPKAVFARESIVLIQKLTGFTEDEENFGICENFVLSNLLYHSFLDPVPSKIKAHYEGLAQKWSIHAKEEKASKLRSLLQKFIQDPLFNSSDDPHGQFDIHYRMLSLVFLLSNSDGVEVSPFGSDEDTHSKSLSTESSSEKPLCFWLDLLQEGEAPFRFPRREDELSEWSDDATSSQSIDLPLDKPFPSSSVTHRKPPLFISVENKGVSIDHRSLTKEIMPRYWELSSLGYKGFPKSFLSTHERLCEKVGIPRSLMIVVTEYQVIRELLWMLRRPTKCGGSLIFKANHTNETFFVNPNVSIPSLAGDSLTEALELYTPTLDGIFTLQEFIAQIANDPSHEIPHTYEAYGEHLSCLLSRFSSSLIQIETAVSRQETTYTLLDLENESREWRKLIQFVIRVHSKGIVRGKGENWYKAIRLISVLNESLGSVFKDNEYVIAVEALLRSLRPYLRIANTWISEGRLEDWRNEFIYRTNPDLKGEKNQHFWEDAFLMRDFEARLLEDGLSPPSFLPFHKIHVSGKSRHILIFLDYIPKASQSSSSSIYEEFLRKLKSILSPCEMPSSLDDVSDSKKNAEARSDGGSLVDDPYLALAFKEVEEIAAISSTDLLEEGEEDRILDDGEGGGAFLLNGYALDSLKSFEPLILSSLGPIIDQHYASSCSTILEFFKKELNLLGHLSSIRKVFLMEDGDLLEDFGTDIFMKMEEKDSLFFDVSNLTLHLRGILSQRRPCHSPELFSVYIAKHQASGERDVLLDQLRIAYSLDWPLSIVITDHHFELYNKVFQFLLKVKRALWALKVISSENIASQDPVKRSKILLLRAWLFHFVGSIHSHLMTRVLHSIEVELRLRLSDCEDLDNLIQLHTDYIYQIVDRCFLNSKSSILRNTVLKVLQICCALKDHVLSDETEDLSALINLEEVYSRSHQFLAITLRSIVQKRNLPHLESLAVALIHSCPEAL